MFYNDRNPPHFHVVCSEFKVVININDEIVQGFMPKRALKLVFEWMDLYKVELLKIGN
jgi:Fe2+ or Zn2+ uptake regulation protein